MQQLFTKKSVSLVVIVAMISLLLVGCGVGQQTQGQAANDPNGQVVFKIGMTLNDKSNFFVGATEFKKRVEEKTNGKIKFEIYPSAVLGNDRDLIEGLSMGTTDMAIVGLTTTNSFVPETQVVSLPFLFRDRDHVAKVLNGPIGDQIASGFDAKGIKFMAYWENGFRNLTNAKRPVKTVADIKGLKIRVVQSPLHVSIWSSLGADPTPITWAEVFTALQQGTVDGQENPLSLIVAAKLNEVQKHLTMTGHVYDPAAVMFSAKSLSKLSPELQKIVLDTAKEVAPYQIAYCVEDEKKSLADLEKKGMKVEKQPELDSFRNAVKPVYEDFIKKYAWSKDMIDKITATK